MTAQKILLADDSVTIRKVVELTFADEGIEVVSVADGDTAMTRFAEIHPDMVIADVNMPGMNGYQICESIKTQDATRHIPVILLVGSFEPFDPGEASRVGANYYFTKPFHSIRELVEKVSEYLALGSASETMAPETADIENLYNQSFQDTLELPDTDEISEQEPSAIATEWGNGNSPFDTGVSAEPASGVVEETLDSFTTNAADDITAPTEAFGESQFSGPEVAASSYERVPDLATHHHAGAVSVSPELGDAGMDDDIIETTHPDLPETAAFTEAAVNPFDEVVDLGGRNEEVERDAAMANFDWRGSETASREESRETTEDARSLKFVIDDDDQGSPSGVGDLHVAPRSDPESSPTTISEANISPELFEKIVRSVIERMSDRAVRETAQEAVPRIAEKLIREALDEDSGK